MMELPKGWATATLDQIAFWGSGGTPSRRNPEYFLGDIPWVKTGELGAKYIRSAEEHISEKAIKSSSAKLFPKGSVGIAMYGATIGKVSILAIDAATNQACAVAQCYPGVFNEYLYYFLASQLNGFVDAGKGGAQPNISQTILKDWAIALPPTPEQRRIVAKIEELFSELDNGVEALTTAREQLKAYRQSVLQHAFEGKLTEGWRRKRIKASEPQASILARLAAERKAHHLQLMSAWSKKLEDWEKRGAIGPKPSRVRALETITPLSQEVINALPSLPPGWVWQKLAWMTCGVDYGTSAKSSKTGSVPVIRMGNLQNGRIDWTDLAFTSEKDEIEQYSLECGDILFNRTNSPELVGKTAIYKGERPAIFAGYLIRINHNPATVDGRYLNYYLNSHFARQHGSTVKTDGVNQSNINGQKLQGYPFPFCSLAEQQEAVRLIEEKLSSCEYLLSETHNQLARANALRQSILKQAFSGQLVAQDPMDEPASELLKRIRAERKKADSNKPGRKTKQTKNGRKDAA